MTNSKNKQRTVYAYPTDTVWGIGCSILVPDGVKIIEAIKNIREHQKPRPYSVMFSDRAQLAAHFDLPESFTETFLQDVFLLECTLCLPLAWARVKIHEWVFQESHHIGVRMLNYPSIRKMIEEAGSPVTSTSLNFTGEEPIRLLADAREFCRQSRHPIQLMEDKSAKLSGNPSTVVIYDEDARHKIVREGSFAREILKKLELRPT